MDMNEALDRFVSENDLWRLEGRKGVENLAKVVNALGYKDVQRYGQLQGGASLGDIIEFLGDNFGCIEAILEWIGSRRNDEWVESLQAVLKPDDLEFEEDADAPKSA